MTAVWPRQSGSDGGTASRYTHVQAEASALWTVVHPLIGFPSVTVVDEQGREGDVGITYVSASLIQISLAGAMSGKAYLN